MTSALLLVHLVSVAAAAAAFWTTAVTDKGGRTHRTAGRWFARWVYAGAATGAALAVMGLVRPAVIPLAAGRDALAAPERHLLWLAFYLLVVIVAPVQHGLAVIVAGPSPLRVRSPAHLALNLAAMGGSVLLFPASIVWREWWFLFAASAGFVVGLRNMSYASRAAAAGIDWQREHLTSLITAGMGFHTALLVFSATRWPWVAGGGRWIWLAWLGPTLVGLPAVLLLRRRKSSYFRSPSLL